MSFGLIAPPALLADPAGADPAGKRALTAAIGDRRPLPPVDCIDPQQIRSTRIVAGTGTGIVYEVNGRLYVQRSQAGAAALRDGDVLVSRIAGGELCQRDAVAGAGRRAAGAQGPLLRVDAVLDEAGAGAVQRKARPGRRRQCRSDQRDAPLAIVERHRKPVVDQGLLALDRKVGGDALGYAEEQQRLVGEVGTEVGEQAGTGARLLAPARLDRRPEPVPGEDRRPHLAERAVRQQATDRQEVGVQRRL